MKEESTKGTESDTRRQLRDKIASLSPSELGRATDALVMIWNGVIGPLDLPPPKPQPTFSPKFTPSPNWHRLQLALLKSIPTGTFIDVQFYAYSAIQDGLPRDLKPLFTSSIVIEEWAAAITTRRLCGTSHFSNADTRQRNSGGRFSSRVPDGRIN
jgi:hypothetical protein